MVNVVNGNGTTGPRDPEPTLACGGCSGSSSDQKIFPDEPPPDEPPPAKPDDEPDNEDALAATKV